MVERIRLRYFLPMLLALASLISIGQTVPAGIHYQAVARDNFGKELIDREIDVMFSIISENPVGPLVYRELHSKVRTSSYGVFSLVIGKGEPTGGTVNKLSLVNWGQANHYLKVEVKFNSDFIDMGTMPFLSVPYALYASKSLEPGPQGPKGDQGDPATDDQTLSFNGSNLSISGGNTVNLSTLSVPHQLNLFGDTLSIMGGNKVGLPNYMQDLQLDVNNKLKITRNIAATEIDLNPFKQDLSYNGTTGMLSITNGTGVDLSALKTDGIQDIQLTGNKLTITKNASSSGVDLDKYLDNTDNQALTYNPSTYSLSITNGGSVNIGSLIAFRAKKLLSTTTSSLTDVTFIPGTVEFNDGNAFNAATGEFVAPVGGIYTFSISYFADGSGSARKLSIFYNSSLYEEIAVEIAAGTLITRSITMKLNLNDTLKLVIFTGTATQTGTGTFSGFRIY